MDQGDVETPQAIHTDEGVSETNERYQCIRHINRLVCLGVSTMQPLKLLNLDGQLGWVQSLPLIILRWIGITSDQFELQAF